MKHILLFIAIISTSLSMAQGEGDLTIYSNTGDKFYVILNGIRQNNQPETNVKITGLTNPYYSCKVISADRTFEIEKNVGVKFDTLITYRIIEKKGKYKMRFFTQASLGTNTAPDPNQSVITYHSTETPTDVQTNQVNNTGNTITNGETTTVTTTTIQNTNTDGRNVDQNGNVITESINMNINIGENGMSTNIDITGNGMENGNVNTNTNTSETLTTTTSSNSTTVNGTNSYEEVTTTTSSTNDNGNSTYYEETTVVTSNNGGNNVTTTTIDDSHAGHDHTSYHNNSCYTNDTEVDQLVKQIQNESFPDDQVRVANIAAKNKCFSTVQIKKISGAFDHSGEKLSFMKTAYDKCPDRSNYYLLMEELTFSSDKEDLEKFINSRN
jgi:hypothetical protein